MKYYNEIKKELINNEINKKVKTYSINRSDLNAYYNVGKQLFLAGKHYGEGIISNYSKRLTKELGRGYTETNLKYFRKFYLFANSHTMCDELSWSHYRTLLSISDDNKVEYYILICRQQKLSVRELQAKIKAKDYERLPADTQNKLITNSEKSIIDYVKNPILIKNSNNYNKFSEKILQKIILEDIKSFLEELGEGFCYIGNEYKIKINDRYNYIDLLLFNIKYNCYVVVELKSTELKKEHIGQIQVYMNFIDSNIKDIYHNKTIGIIICKKDNKYIIRYCSDKRIVSREYSFI